ncbi:site-2 protease family protein [Thiococcus pfennigii]|jgi:Zn-dependent protease|uniref:site-2 protease family protein n=1 Tax=Thiococcus pfennigii TaxID=1057 RepID=UPI0019045670|nr:site-2 protease family protein [Thiococcus pfennigii]MBK1699846.1 site-2 protease family protein [Thiococcus pfennigii]MBK1731642.1 site-2 protease family protein [Thiococcus pfennigii]
MESINAIQLAAVLVIPVLFAITAHEAAHGWVASRLGDPTARQLGRVTFNPFKHVDPIGTLAVPVATFFLGGFLFGWAKPVPVDWRNLRDPRRDMALVALAGPGANLVMALFWGLMVQLGLALGAAVPWLAAPLLLMGAAGVLINVLLMVLNLFPLPPLDGGRVLTALLPPRWAMAFARLEPYGLILLLALLVFGVLGGLLWPVMHGLIELLPGGPAALAIVAGLLQQTP